MSARLHHLAAALVLAPFLAAAEVSVAGVNRLERRLPVHAWLLGMALAGCATAPPVEPPAPRPGTSSVSPTLEEAAQLSAARSKAIRLLRGFIEKHPDDAHTPDAVRRLLAAVSDGGEPAELAATVAWLRTLPLRDAELRERLRAGDPGGLASSAPPPAGSSPSDEVERAGACSADAECVRLGDFCHAGCSVTVNRKHRDAVLARLSSVHAECAMDCPPVDPPICRSGRCESPSR